MCAAPKPSPGRPPGEVRQLMVQALRTQGPLAMRELACVTQVGFDVARKSLARFVATGVLVKARTEKRAHSKKCVALYDVAPEPQPDAHGPRHGHGWVDLGRVVGGWAR